MKRERDLELIYENTFQRYAAQWGTFRPSPKDSNLVKIKLKIIKNEYNEYVVKFYANGYYDETKSYFTDDKEDAIETMKKMKVELKQKGYIVED